MIEPEFCRADFADHCDCSDCYKYKEPAGCPFCDKNEVCPGFHSFMDVANASDSYLEMNGLIRINKYKELKNKTRQALDLLQHHLNLTHISREWNDDNL